MDDFTPIPFGSLRAVFRDPTAEAGLMVRPVVGFTAPPTTGGAAIFGGPDADHMYAGRPPAANPGAVGVPVIVTRRGELRGVVTYQGPPEGPEDTQEAAPADVGLRDREIPTAEFLGLVQLHEEPSEVFRAHIDAAAAHKALVERLNAAPERPEVPPRTVDAEISDADSERPAVTASPSLDDVLSVLFNRAEQTETIIEDDAEDEK